jgi:hypothetical protein
MNARDLSEPPKNGTTQDPPSRPQNYACATYVIKILYEVSYLYPDGVCLCGNTKKREIVMTTEAAQGSQSTDFVIKTF